MEGGQGVPCPPSPLPEWLSLSIITEPKSLFSINLSISWYFLRTQWDEKQARLGFWADCHPLKCRVVIFVIAGAIALIFRSTEIKILKKKLKLIINSSIFAGENFTELEYLTTKRPQCQSRAVNLIQRFSYWWGTVNLSLFSCRKWASRIGCTSLA